MLAERRHALVIQFDEGGRVYYWNYAAINGPRLGLGDTILWRLGRFWQTVSRNVQRLWHRWFPD
jgi:hypothetical protein